MTVQPKIVRTEAEEALLNLFETVHGDLPGRAETRRAAISDFAARGLPHRRVEEWKYTDLRALMRSAAPLATTVDGAEIVPPALPFAAHRLIIANGRFDAAQSNLSALPQGVQVRGLAECLTAGDAVAEKIGTSFDLSSDHAVALNDALMTDGIVLEVAPDATIEGPIEITHVVMSDTPIMAVTRNLVFAEAGTKVTIVERFVGPDGVSYQTNAVSELFAGDGAEIHWTRLQNEGDAALHLGTVSAHVAANTRYHLFNLAEGAKVARFQPYLTFAGEGSNADMAGIAMLRGKQHADTTLVVDHAVPNCNSKELYKAAVDHEARSVFQGKIIVRKDAQKTDGQMANNTLLLSETAEANSKPELEIFADDVVCGHGATCGELDDALLFYLRARGLPSAEAEKLLVTAFLSETLDTIANEATAEFVAVRVHDWLERRGLEQA